MKEEEEKRKEMLVFDASRMEKRSRLLSSPMVLRKLKELLDGVRQKLREGIIRVIAAAAL
jgi:hypothetical protein